MTPLPWPLLDVLVIAGGLGFVLGIAFTLHVQWAVGALHRRRP